MKDSKGKDIHKIPAWLWNTIKSQLKGSFPFCFLFFFFQKQTALKLGSTDFRSYVSQTDTVSKSLILEEPYLSEIITTTLKGHPYQNLGDFIDSWRLYGTRSSLCLLTDLSIIYVFLNLFAFAFCEFHFVSDVERKWRWLSKLTNIESFIQNWENSRPDVVQDSLIIFQSQRTYWGLK